jgi:magnesium transporter
MPPLSQEHLDDRLFAYLRRDFTPLTTGQTVGQALAFLRSQQLGERLIYFFVTTPDGRLQGVIPTRRLLMTDPAEPVDAIMLRDVVTLPTWATVRDACEAFVRHRLLAFPIVDSQHYLHGVVDVALFTDQIADMTGRQSADDIFQLIGVHVSESATAWTGFKTRVPWLYEPLLAAFVVLALFIPVVLALAESVSIQSVTLTLQRLHSHVSGQRFVATLAKEVLTAILLGLTCGTTVAAVSFAWKGQAAVAEAIAVAITLSMVTACALGVILPTMLRAARRDPRIAAGPVVLALADLATLLFYFNLSGMWLT